MLELSIKGSIILFLTVEKNKIATVHENTGSVAIFSVVSDYGILFSAFTFFLDCFHMTFGDKLKAGIKTTDFVQSIG